MWCDGQTERRVAAGTTTGRDAARRVARELDRLEALGARRRLRVRVLRTLRGSLGAGATVLAMIKLKVAGSLVLKVALALLVGLGIAWPMTALAVLGAAWLVLSLVLMIASLLDGSASHHSLDPSCDCPDGCARREARAARLKRLIATRRAWLANPAGPAPSPASEAAGTTRGQTRAR